MTPTEVQHAGFLHVHPNRTADEIPDFNLLQSLLPSSDPELFELHSLAAASLSPVRNLLSYLAHQIIDQGLFILEGKATFKLINVGELEIRGRLNREAALFSAITGNSIWMPIVGFDFPPRFSSEVSIPSSADLQPC